MVFLIYISVESDLCSQDLKIVLNQLIDHDYFHIISLLIMITSILTLEYTLGLSLHSKEENGLHGMDDQI